MTLEFFMSEHAIRLRAGWTGWYSDGPRKVDLPTFWRADEEWPARLTRRFQAPRIETIREGVSLRLESVLGVHTISLNGRTLLRLDEGREQAEVPIDAALQPSNLLELDLGRAPAAASPECQWGRIALVIRPVAQERQPEST